MSFDQLTKIWIVEALRTGEVRPLISGFLNLTSTQNSGFAFGLLQKISPSFQEVFSLGIPFFALVLIVLIFIKLQDNQMLTSTALTTILAGAIGNLVDRVRFGYVIDFLDFHLGQWHFPAMNVADLSILSGVVMMFVGTLGHD